MDIHCEPTSVIVFAYVTWFISYCENSGVFAEEEETEFSC